jgi:ferredoxin-NADP reductase
MTRGVEFRVTRLVDAVLNHVTMYRLVLAYAAGLLVLAFLLGFAHLVPQDPTALAFSAVVIFGTCWLTNRVLASVLRVPANMESYAITALILALLFSPVTAKDGAGVAGLVVASVVAIASKFLIAPGRKHIFNPVAAGATAAALLLGQPATWWVGGNAVMLVPVLLGGLLVVRKVRQWGTLATYIVANLAVTLATTPPDMMLDALSMTFLSSPLLFAGFAMLTEPLTAAHGKRSRLVFGAIVGAVSSANFHIGGFYPTPEMAFLAGNLFAWAATPKGRFRLTLLRIEKMASGCYDFVFQPDRQLAFEAGQYIDWTLDVPIPDNRGNRRTFTIASAPGEKELRLGVKFHPDPSAFKRTLAALQPGDVVYASHIAGHFTLPRNPETKIAFIAGGIGVTPFRSMVEELLRRGERRDVVMLYGNNRLSEIAYVDLFEAAGRIGLRTVYAVAEPEEEGYDIHTGFIDEALIRREIGDWRERVFFLSGPRAMVVRFERALRGLGVPRGRIKTDFFPGFA